MDLESSRKEFILYIKYIDIYTGFAERWNYCRIDDATEQDSQLRGQFVYWWLDPIFLKKLNKKILIFACWSIKICISKPKSLKSFNWECKNYRKICHANKTVIQNELWKTQSMLTFIYYKFRLKRNSDALRKMAKWNNLNRTSTYDNIRKDQDSKTLKLADLSPKNLQKIFTSTKKKICREKHDQSIIQT